MASSSSSSTSSTTETHPRHGPAYDSQDSPELRTGVSLFAGAVAGGVEGALTYPLEYVKTRCQLKKSIEARNRSPWAIFRVAIREGGTQRLYSGVGAVVTGNIARVGVRFSAYDRIKASLQKPDGGVSGARSLFAALGAGCVEATLVTTPSEAVKTKIVDGSRGVNLGRIPLTFIEGTRSIIARQGLRGLWSGYVPTFLRQGFGSTVRFGSYGTIKNLVQGSSRPGQALPGGITFGIGAISGALTVYATMPIDVVKSRSQSLDARSAYGNFFRCFGQVAHEEGLRGLFRGTTPRMVRLALAGGITFSIYEEITALLGHSS